MAGAPDLVRDAVRRAAPERYLTTLYAPAALRPALWALHAFDAEIGSIRDRVREPLAGELRLQWWRDAISGVQGGATGNPVADALNRTIADHALPATAFADYLEARIFDLYDDPMPSRTDLEGYCGETAGAVIQLSCMILDPEAAPRFAALAGHAGCTQAITGLLRMLPRHRARGQCYVPRDLLAAAGTTPEAFVSGGDAAGAQRAVAAMVALAREHLAAFRQEATQLPQSLRPAFLQVSLASLELDAMRDPEAVLRGSAGPSLLRRHWSLLFHAMRGWKPVYSAA